MTLPRRLLLNKTQISHHLSIAQDKAGLFTSELDEYEPLEGSSSRAPTFLLRDVVQAMVTHFVRRSRGDEGDEAKVRTERARATKMEADNFIKHGQYVSRMDIVEHVAERAATAGRAFDAVIPALARKFPDIPPDYLSAVRDEVDRARNRAVDALTIDPSEISQAADNDDDEPDPEPEEDFW